MGDVSVLEEIKWDHLIDFRTHCSNDCSYSSQKHEITMAKRINEVKMILARLFNFVVSMYVFKEPQYQLHDKIQKGHIHFDCITMRDCKYLVPSVE